MIDVLFDAILDSLKVLPFLILAYLVIELLEHATAAKFSARLLNGKLSPLIGAGLGVIPQCGFSVVATKLYTNRSIAMGTLLAVYLSTSDEAIAVLVSDFSAIDKLLPLLAIKVVFAVAIGYAVNFFCRKKELNVTNEQVSAVGCHNHVVGKDDDCAHCCDESDCHSDEDHKIKHRRNAIKRYVAHPLLHAAITFGYIFAVNFVLGAIIFWVGKDALVSFMGEIAFLQPLLAAIVGLIPNCASSVVIAQMYAVGTLSLGGAISGLCVSAGLGLAVLVKENKSVKDTAVVIGLLFLLSVALGLAVTAVTAII